MKNKGKNFVSAVVYVRNNENEIYSFLKVLNKQLESNFEKYEIICVDDFSNDNSINEIYKFGRELHKGIISILHMSYEQGLEVSMNAGLDLSIGDFVYEFDSVYIDYNDNLIMDVYYKSLQGFDIVSSIPDKAMKISSKIFYKLFNRYSNIPNKIKTETFRILSRRAINRIYAMSKTIPYRKAIYSSCGLKITSVQYEIVDKVNRHYDNQFRLNIAIDSLILFTNIGYKISLVLTAIMMVLTLCSGIYTVFIFLSSNPIEGWTTTMLIISFSFFALFFVIAIMMRYLSILIHLLFNKQKYVIENIEKI